MRKDMKKVLVECYRQRSQEKFREFRHDKANQPDLDEDGNFVEHRKSMKRLHRTRSFGENLSPIPRFLKANVGRPWDKVYSEIRETCDSSSAVGNHIMQHMWGWVVRPELIFYKGGKPWVRTEGWVKEQPLANSNMEFFVNEAGILLENRNRKTRGQRHRENAKKWKEELAKKEKDLTPFLVLKKEEGLWYSHSYALCGPRRQRVVKPWDMPMSKWVGLSEIKKKEEGRVEWYRDTQGPDLLSPDRYLVSRKLLSTKELKMYELENDPPEEKPRPESQRDRSKKK